MKYKNRLIVPTLVSTGLLASTIVVNAEEVEQDEQYSEQNIAEYSNADQTSETDLDFIDSDEESPEDSDEEESEDDSEEEASDEVDEDADITDEEESDAETDEESEETAEENKDLDDVEEETQDEDPEAEEAASEDVDETEIAEEDVETPVEEETDTEVTAEETQDEESETEEEASEEIDEEETDTETELNSEASVEAEETETPAEDVTEESAEETDTEEESEETVAEESSEENFAEEAEESVENINSEEEQEVPAEDESEEEITEESEEPVEETDSEENAVDDEENQEVPEEDDNEEGTTKESEEPVEETDSEESSVDDEDNQEVPDEDDSEEEITDEIEEQEAPSEEESEESNEVEEAAVSEDESETAEPETEDIDSQNEEVETEEDTYKYDSESLEQELENLSEEDRTAFLEENADDIEADEEMLNELAETVSEEHGVDLTANEVYSADASTFSTMSVSQAITDINEYIAANDFDVAEIQYDLIEGLPEYAYESNYGWEPENGKPGQPSGVVLHDVGNENSTIHGEISYMSENWDNAFVHAFVDADNIIQTANTDYLAYGAGEYSNQTHLHVELVRHDNQHDFAKSINNYADYIANLLYKYKLPAERVDASTEEGTLWSHVEVSHIMGGTASPDPYEYFQSHGYAYEDVINLIGQRYDNLYNKVTDPSIYMPTFESDTENVAGEITNQNRGIYESITDVRTGDASNYLGQDLNVVRSEVYNFEEYYLLADAEGNEIGWMYAGDVVTSALDVDPEEETETPEPETPDEDEIETPEPEAPENNDDNNKDETPEPEPDDSSDNEGSDDTGNGDSDDSSDQTPEEDEENSQNDGTEDQPENDSDETPEESSNEEENEGNDQENDEEPVESSDGDDTSNEDTSDEGNSDDGSSDTEDEEDTDETLESDVDYETENSIQIGAGDTFVGESIAPGTYLITNQDHDIGGNISVWYTDEYGIEHARIIEIIGSERNATNGVRVTLQENDRISIENTEDMLFTPSSDIVDDENELGISQADDGYNVIPGEFIVGQGIAPGSYTVSNTDEIGSNFVVWGPADEYGFEDLKYNEIIGTGDHAIPSLEVELAEGDRIEISGANDLLFSSTGAVPETDEESDDAEGDQNTDTGSDEGDDDSVNQDDTSNEGTGNTGSDDSQEGGADTGSTDMEEDDTSGGATADNEDGEVYSSLEDPETGVRVISQSDELDGKSLVVTVLGSSDAIGAAHDLYDIHVLDENGSLYDLQNPVTVYLPAGGYVSNVYYLGNIGETLEAVNYRTEDGYAVFETDSFSQYAVVYGDEDADNTTVATVSENKDHSAGETSTDRANEHPAVYTEDADDSEDAAAAAGDSGDGSADASESEVLPNTGVAEQSTTIFAAVLAALGLGFLVKRRKPTNK